MAYAMRYATHDDMKIIRRHISDEDVRAALDHTPPGVIDGRSWAYWNSKMGRYPAPPLPTRRLGSLGVRYDRMDGESHAWPAAKLELR
jgi:hypothetical protein